MLSGATPVCLIATSDAKKARLFYEDILGLELISEDDIALVFRLSGTVLRVQKVLGFRPQEYTPGFGIPTAICFRSLNPSEEDL